MAVAAQLVHRGAARYGDRPAVRYGERTWSFAEVAGSAYRLGRALLQLGGQSGDPIGLLVDNGPDSVPVDFALLTSGLVRVPLNSRLALDEHATMLRAPAAGCSCTTGVSRPGRPR